VNAALAEYAGILRARWRYPFWGLLLGLATLTVLLLVRPPVYESRATVMVRTPGDVSRVVDAGDFYAQTRTRTFAALATGTGLASRVVADNGLNMSPESLAASVSANPRPGTVLIDIAVRADTAGQAQHLASVYLSELTALVRTVESVPGSLVPRSELVIVDPPAATRLIGPLGISLPLITAAIAIAGVVLGAAAAVLRSLFDDSVRDARDAGRVCGRTVFGLLPADPGRCTDVAEQAAMYRLLTAMGSPAHGAITVTEPDGTSSAASTAAWLASALAQRYDTVLLVDLDFVSADLTKLASDPEQRGVLEVLAGQCTAAQATLDCHGVGFLGTGAVTDAATVGPVESVALRRLIVELRQSHSWVVLTCPAAADAPAIGEVSDAVVLAVKNGVTTAAELRSASTMMPSEVVCGVIFDSATGAVPVQLPSARHPEATE
jgi:capsular polysaccharide biosynthesis protein